ncbi:MAG: anti-sigma factor [Blastocatellia bacterium]|nr:anti-sigma factor [Blastocatellia bacterium]
MKQCEFTQEQREHFILSYLTGDLPLLEKEQLESHLSECSCCRQGLAQSQELLSLLAYSSPVVSPPDSIRVRLLERVASKDKKAIASNVVKMSVSAKRINWRRYAWQIAASILLAMFIIQSYYLFDSNAKLKQQTKDQENRIAKLENQLQQKNEQIESMVKSTRLIVLDGKEVMASGRAFWNTNGNSWMFYFEKLPPAPKGKTYQLWFMTNLRPISAGAFQTNADGTIQLHVKTPSETPIVGTAVSLEPEGGSEKPVGTIYLLGFV